MDIATGNRIIGLRERVTANFAQANWDEIGMLTGQSSIIDNHPRLIRSLSWGDEDYAGNALQVLKKMIEAKPFSLNVIEEYLDQKFPGESHFISAKPSTRKISFAPTVFQIPDGNVEIDLVAVMMPFASKFRSVFESIKSACGECGLRCLRADDIWDDATIMQDVFSLIFRAQVVVVDFTGKNPNVMYETGIAHTLGKHVVPLSQHLGDLPSDMTHHRVMTYLANGEGLKAFERALSSSSASSGRRSQPRSRLRIAALQTVATFLSDGGRYQTAARACNFDGASNGLAVAGRTHALDPPPREADRPRFGREEHVPEVGRELGAFPDPCQSPAGIREQVLHLEDLFARSCRRE
jgi:hypothetical protein